MNFVAGALKYVASRLILVLLLIYPTLWWVGIDPVELLLTPQMVAAIAASCVMIGFEKFAYEFNRDPDVELNIENE